MAKSKIIKELANGEISLEVALNRLIIIASDIESDKLAQWAENELNGYPVDSELPVYRIVSNMHFVYSGINGKFTVNNAPLLLMEIVEANKKDYEFCVRDGVKSLISLIENKCEYGRDLTFLAGTVKEKTGILCTSIKQIVPSNEVMNIISTIKSKLLKALIKLDKEYGCLDELDIDITKMEPEEVKKINATIINFIFEDRSIKMGDKNRIDKSDIQSGGENG